MLAGVVEVHDLDGDGEVLLTDVPDPNRTISHEDFEDGAIPAAMPGFGVEAQAKLLGSLNGADIAGGTFVAHRTTFRIRGGLGEDTAEFGFARVRGLAGLFALPALRLSDNHRYAGAIDLDA